MHLGLTCIEVKIKISMLAFIRKVNFIFPILRVFCKMSNFLSACNFTVFPDVVPWLVRIVLGVSSFGTPSMGLL